MKWLIHQDQLKYDGTQLSSLWSFRNFKIQGDSIVAFYGECEVKLENMVDLADVLNNEPIFSEQMVHFIVEIFQLDLEKTIMIQRLLICIIKEVLEKRKCRPVRHGDDLYIKDKKLSVSIATLSRVSSLIHVGINISSNNTPVPTVGLSDLHISYEQFTADVLKNFINEFFSIKMARCKVRGVD